MINLGKKNQNNGPEVASSSSKGSISYPEFYVDGITLPVNSSDVGKTITATVQLKVKKAGNEIDYNNKKNYRATFCVVSMELHKKKTIDPSSLSSAELDELEKAEYSYLAGVNKKVRRR